MEASLWDVYSFTAWTTTTRMRWLAPARQHKNHKSEFCVFNTFKRAEMSDLTGLAHVLLSLCLHPLAGVSITSTNLPTLAHSFQPQSVFVGFYSLPTCRYMVSRLSPCGFWKQLYSPLWPRSTSVRMSRGPFSRCAAFTSVPFTFHDTEASLSREPHCMVTSLPIWPYWLRATANTHSRSGLSFNNSFRLTKRAWADGGRSVVA